jgi:hypothetical protein
MLRLNQRPNGALQVCFDSVNPAIKMLRQLVLPHPEHLPATANTLQDHVTPCSGDSSFLC